jgi:flagellar biosynthesis protein FlhB
MASQDRTEQPTTKKQREARRDGKIARSRDLALAGSMAATTMALVWSGRGMMDALGQAVSSALAHLDRFPSRDLRADEMGLLAVDGFGTFARVIAPVAGTALISTVALFAVQGGWVFSTRPLGLKFEKLSPANGIKRLGMSAGGIETVKMFLLAGALAYISYGAIKNDLMDAARFARMSPLQSALAGWTDIQRLLMQSVIVMVAVAAGDYGLQRWRFTTSLKMTKQEVKDDFKEMEGNPQIKGRIRSIQMALARQRMMAAVPKATVVITNPTHFAVALEYRRAEMAAPRVLAKGRGIVAQKIKAIAREHGVPTVENVQLAQSLYKTVEVGDFIPAALFEAVAEVLAYLIRLKRLAL